MEQALQSIVLDALYRVNAEVDLSKQWQVFNKPQLVHLFDVIQIEVQELETLDGFQTSQLLNLVFGEVEGSQNWQRVQAFDLGELVGAQEHFFDP